ncbi:N-acylglucosamine 2-epimerase [Aeromicrobium sp. Root236]|uniref:thioredoxin domain-containing protein n=1 Tax=Aeromicrobium sp. Root236 TaxID=1736498 RepID=UPI0006F700AC|nr:thioredoxin domain-containing protein [Aeromicrobium sp. Root236]KRC66382.1 N-acylglucosamine 2-epimerase [Aeromicrobium sp. Root236]
MPNRLAQATSPYLQQHADNPVDWWEWSDEALAVAQELDRPILLSVGYAACHWCHVMAHESFEDAATAAYMNDHFVNIKVDREERPDIDAVYMKATTAMTGQGGWPMTCVLTPTGEPFFAGTYFPPEPRQGAPAFTQVLQALAEAWRDRRDEVLKVSGDVLEHLRQNTDTVGGPLGPDELDEAVAELAKQYDVEAGGFGTSPKFPPSMVLEFLLRNAARTGSEQALAMVAGSCEAMARGGMYDQLSGGFARYSVDRFWRVPHFEKMLYDNALLLRVYLHWWRQSGSPLAERIARETARFMLDELRTPEGGFASALDADSDGHEGTFYVWNPNQLMRLLGADDGAWAAQLLGVTGPGTFERGFSTLQLRVDPDDAERWHRVRTTLLAARAERTRPARDDKVVASWNGLAITALAEAAVLLDEPDFADAAVAAAQLLVDVHLADGFARTSRDGVAGGNSAVLEDHGAVAEAFIAVLGITGEAVWLDRARLLLDRVVEHFVDPEGGFFDTADDSENLVVRPKDASDNAYPSGTSAAVAALLSFAAITGEHGYRAAAESGIASAANIATQVPRFAGWTLAAAEAVVAGPLEVAVVGPREDRAALHHAAVRLASPGAVVIAGDVGLAIPLFQQRDLVGGRPAAYVCEGFVCRQPVTDPDELLSSVSGPARA